MTSSSTLPAHWRLEPLGSRVSLLSGFAFDSSNFATEGGEALIRIRDLKVGRSETRYVGSYDERYLVMDGDFLIGMDGEFGCYKWQGGRALLNQRVCKLIGSSDVDLRFVAYGIGRHLKQIEQNTSYTTVKHLSARQIRAISFAFPRLAEQRRIADRLDEAMAEISAARSALKRQQIEIDAVQSRAAQEQFGGSPPVPMVEIIADTRNGLYKPEGYYGAGTPILKMFNIDRFANRITTERLDRLEATEQERKKGELRSGDILVNRVNSRDLVGKCACIGRSRRVFCSKARICGYPSGPTRPIRCMLRCG